MGKGVTTTCREALAINAEFPTLANNQLDRLLLPTDFANPDGVATTGQIVRVEEPCRNCGEKLGWFREDISSFKGEWRHLTTAKADEDELGQKYCKNSSSDQAEPLKALRARKKALQGLKEARERAGKLLEERKGYLNSTLADLSSQKGRFYGSQVADQTGIDNTKIREIMVELLRLVDTPTL